VKSTRPSGTGSDSARLSSDGTGGRAPARPRSCSGSGRGSSRGSGSARIAQPEVPRRRRAPRSPTRAQWRRTSARTDPPQSEQRQRCVDVVLRAELDLGLDDPVVLVLGVDERLEGLPLSGARLAQRGLVGRAGLVVREQLTVLRRSTAPSRARAPSAPSARLRAGPRSRPASPSRRAHARRGAARVERARARPSDLRRGSWGVCPCRCARASCRSCAPPIRRAGSSRRLAPRRAGRASARRAGRSCIGRAPSARASSRRRSGSGAAHPLRGRGRIRARIRRSSTSAPRDRARSTSGARRRRSPRGGASRSRRRSPRAARRAAWGARLFSSSRIRSSYSTPAALSSAILSPLALSVWRSSTTRGLSSTASTALSTSKA
jgi:hypothetical protein